MPKPHMPFDLAVSFGHLPCVPPSPQPSSRPPSLPAPQPRQMVLLRNDGNQPLLFSVAHDLSAVGLGGELRRRSDDDESAAAAAQQLLEVRPVRGVVPPGQDVQLQVGGWVAACESEGVGLQLRWHHTSGGAVGRFSLPSILPACLCSPQATGAHLGR